MLSNLNNIVIPLSFITIFPTAAHARVNNSERAHRIHRPPEITALGPRMTVVIAPGTNRHFSYTATAAVTADRIWAQWMDVSAWPTWDSELLAARADAPLAAGVCGSATPLRGRTSTFRVTEFADLRRFTFVTKLPLASLIITRSLVAHNDGTSFTHDVRFDGLLGPVFAAALGPSFRRALPQVMLALAARAADSTVGAPFES